MSDEQLVADVEQWLSWEVNEASATHIRDLLQAKDHAALRKLFYPRIAFGTAGLRACMAPGPHNINELVVIQSSQGLAKYVSAFQASKGNDKPSVVIGYDGRYNSKTYAELTAAVFLRLGFSVLLFNKIVATPLVPFAIRQLKLSCGVMVTASHNPKDDNGYKVYWENSAQIIPPHDQLIAQSIADNLKPWGCTFDANHPELVDRTEEIIHKYFDAIKQYSYRSAEENAGHELGVVYTAMHGVGAPFAAQALEVFGLPPYFGVPEQVQPDPGFPTVRFPNPEEGKGALQLSFEAALRANRAAGGRSEKFGPRFRLILANDPDADRLAVAELQTPFGEGCAAAEEEAKDAGEAAAADEGWRIFNGNEIAVLFADWVWQKFAEKHANEPEVRAKAYMLSSTVSSAVLGAMAAKEGFQFRDTLTGFKWMGNVADELIEQGGIFLFAFEVEIGFLIGDISLDKDGVRTLAVFNELAQHWYTQGLRLSDRLAQLEQKYGYFEMNTHYFFAPTPEVGDRVFAGIRRKSADAESIDYPKEIGGLKVLGVRDLTLGTDSRQPDGKSLLPMTPDAHMITFYLEGGAVITLRNSGTEPKLKYYVECMDPASKAEARGVTDALTAAMINELLRPGETGLLTKEAMQALEQQQQQQQ